MQVTRCGASAVHLVTTAVSVDTEVTVTIDWDRRWEHMQQHSGKHNFYKLLLIVTFMNALLNIIKVSMFVKL